MTKKPTRRNQEIAGKVLLSQATLESVGKEYGLTRERVRQIIKRQGIEYKKVKKGLLSESDRFRCDICGGIKPTSRLFSPYCSNICRKIWNIYDFSNPKYCHNCSNIFYPFRHGKYVKSIKSKYCSLKCYFESMPFAISRNFAKKILEKIEMETLKKIRELRVK